MSAGAAVTPRWVPPDGWSLNPAWSAAARKRCAAMRIRNLGRDPRISADMPAVAHIGALGAVQHGGRHPFPARRAPRVAVMGCHAASLCIARKCLTGNGYRGTEVRGFQAACPQACPPQWWTTFHGARCRCPCKTVRKVSPPRDLTRQAAFRSDDVLTSPPRPCFASPCFGSVPTCPRRAPACRQGIPASGHSAAASALRYSASAAAPSLG